MKPVCLVIGAGAGIGGTVAKRFASEGYYACLCRRSEQEGLDKLVAEIEAAGGSASGSLLNAVKDDTIEELVESIASDIGPIKVAIYNLGAQIGNRTLADTPHKTFEIGWRLGTFGLYRLAYSVMPHMVERGKGTILVTVIDGGGAWQFRSARTCRCNGWSTYAVSVAECRILIAGHSHCAYRY